MATEKTKRARKPSAGSKLKTVAIEHAVVESACNTTEAAVLKIAVGAKLSYEQTCALLVRVLRMSARDATNAVVRYTFNK